MKEVLTRLDALAAKLNTTGEHLWQVLIRQAGVMALRDSITVVICAATVFILIRTALSLYRKAEATRNEGTEVGCMAGCILCFICVAVMVMFGSSALLDLPTELFNPEYWALREVMRALGGK